VKKFSGMKLQIESNTALFEKALYIVGAIGSLLIIGVAAAYWWANTVPMHPKGVSPTAVFLWAPYVGFPGPRRGSWIACSEQARQNRCTLNEIDGTIEYEGGFVPYGRKDAINADQLKIDPVKSRDYKVGRRSNCSLSLLGEWRGSDTHKQIQKGYRPA
jgi:hypothetical protein